MSENTSIFEVVHITTLSQLKEYWSFFYEGLQKLNTLVDPERKIKTETFFRIVVDVADSDGEKGLVSVVKHAVTKELLFFGVVCDVTTDYQEKTCLVYAAYSNEHNSMVVQFGLRYAEKWAKERGFVEMQALSPRVSRHGMYLFEKRWGFKRRSLLFTKAL